MPTHLLHNRTAEQSVFKGQSCSPPHPSSSAVFLSSLHPSEDVFFPFPFWVSSLPVTKVPSCSLSSKIQTTFNRDCLPSPWLAPEATHQIAGILRTILRIMTKCHFARQFKNRITNISLQWCVFPFVRDRLLQSGPVLKRSWPPSPRGARTRQPGTNSHLLPTYRVGRDPLSESHSATTLCNS